MTFEIFQVVFPFWIRAFCFTLIMEVPIFVLIGRMSSTKENPIPIWRLAIAGAVGTVITHPLLWFAWSQLISNYTVYIVSGELMIAVIESITFWLIAKPITFKRAMAASFIANAASYGGGVVFQALTG